MFCRISWACVIVTSASIAVSAEPQVRRTGASPSARPGVIQQVAGNGNSGLLGGLKGIFGSSDNRSSNGTMPDAPVGRQAPMDDWSDIAHKPNRTKTTQQKTGAPAKPVNPNVPTPPPAGGARTSSSEPSNSGKSAARINSPVASGIYRDSRNGDDDGTISEAKEYDTEKVSESTVPKVARRPVPPSPSASRTSESGSYREGSESSGAYASDQSAGRRTERSSKPGLSLTRESDNTSDTSEGEPETPPSIASKPTTRPASNGTKSTPAAPAPTNPIPSTVEADGLTVSPPSNSLPNLYGPAGTTAPQTAGANADSFSTRGAPMNSSPIPQKVVGPNTQAPAASVANVSMSTSTSEIPAIRVIARGPEEIAINQPMEYEVLVENRSAVNAPGMLIRATIPEWTTLRGHHESRGEANTENDGGMRQLTWQLPSVPAGGSERLMLRLTAEKATPFEVRVEWTFMPQTNIANVRVQEPKIDLAIDGPEAVVFGMTALYKVRVSNPGTGIAQDVTFTLSPNSPTPQSQRLGDIPPGKEAQFEIELSAQDRGQLEIHGLVTAKNNLRSESNKRIRVSFADLVATLDGPPLKYQNTESSYRLLLVNEGTAASQTIIAQMQIPSGVKYLGGIEGAQISGDTLRWTIVDLQPSQTREYNFRCNMINTGAHKIAFQCRGSAAGAAEVAIATKVEAVADLVLTINDPTAPAPVGSEVMYEILLKNRGSKAAMDITAIAQFSQSIEPTRIDGHNGKIVPGQVLFEPIARLDPGQEMKLRVYAKADSDGVHRFRTEVTSGEIVLVAEEATKYVAQSSDRVSRKSTDAPMR